MPSTNNQRNVDNIIKAITVIFFCLIIISVFLIRCHRIRLPLERDEGEFAYFGQLILQGIVPFKIACNMKLPGVSYIYAIFFYFLGESISAIHIGLAVVNLLSIALLFILSKRLFGFLTAVITSMCFAVMSISQSVLGLHAHATQFLVLFELLGFIAMIYAAECRKPNKLLIFLSGLCFGLSLLMKQHAIFFVILGIWYIHVQSKHLDRTCWRIFITNSLYFILGSIIPFFIICVVLVSNNVFEKFYFWCFYYAKEYSYINNDSNLFKYLLEKFPKVYKFNEVLWDGAFVGLVFAITDRNRLKQFNFIIYITVASALSIIPGFVFRNHYFIMMLPAVALLNGIFFNSVIYRFEKFRINYITRLLFVFSFMFLMVWSIVQQESILFSMDDDSVMRQAHQSSIFSESIKVAQYIQNNSNKTDLIAVLASEPEIYFYSHRKSAIEYLYMYPLFEKQPFAYHMQRQVIQQIEKNNPKFIIFYPFEYSESEKFNELRGPIIDWLDDYLKKHYVVKGLIFLDKANGTKRYFDKDAQSVSYKAYQNITIFERT